MKRQIFCFILVIVSIYAYSSFEESKKDCVKERAAPKSCDERTPYPSIDGTCNNLQRTNLGASNTRMKRLLDAVYFDPKNLYLPLGHVDVHGKNGSSFPTAQEVSDRILSVIHQDLDNRKQVSQLHMTFGQFIDHDLSLSNNPGGCKPGKCTSDGFKYPCFPIRESSKHSGGKCSAFTRSFGVCKDGKREQINRITAFIDGSLIYGNDKKRHDRLIGENGLLLNHNGILPKDTKTNDMCKGREGGCYLAGDVRVNEHIGLSSFHTIFVRLHNYIAKQLKKINWLWGSKRIFNEARNIVIAILQHITYKEYVPTLTTLRYYRGYRKDVNPQIPMSFSTAAFRFGHSQVKGTWSLLNKHFNEMMHVKLRDTYFDNTLITKHGIEPIVYGLIGNKSERVDTTFSDGVAKHLFIPSSDKHGFQNLAALNIQRGRDHGVPGYNRWREFLGLGAKTTFHGFRREIRNYKLLNKMKAVYGTTDNNIDLFVAGLAEDPVYGKLVGPTFSRIIRRTFEDVRDGDRFWYQSKKLFTYQQYMEIRKMTMAKVLCYTLNGIVSIQRNVFEVFDHHFNRRTACENHPDIDLTAWQETPAKYRYWQNYGGRFYPDRPYGYRRNFIDIDQYDGDDNQDDGNDNDPTVKDDDDGDDYDDDGYWKDDDDEN